MTRTPQAPEIEEAVIGTLMSFGNSIDEVMTFLRPEMFHSAKLRRLFTTIEALYLRHEAIDLLTVSNELRKIKKLEEAGGDFFLVELMQKISSSAHLEFHGRILFQKYIQRALISNSNAIIKEAYSDADSLDLLDKAYSHLNGISNLIITNKTTDLKSLTGEILVHAGKLYRGEIKAGIDTPIKNLTARMGGWRNSELIILAARPGMGKTAFALKAGWQAALEGIPVAFFSLEMSSAQLLSRLWSMDCKIELNKFIQNGLSPEENKQVITRLTSFPEIPFYIDDDPYLTMQTISVKAKQMKKEKGIKLLIVDYLQLMSGNKNLSREQAISEISRGLKLLAKELNIPVIALSQLSRAVETRGGSKRPLLSDLRESGAIEQDADVVQFIYRPEYYGIDEWDDYEHQPCAGEAEYIVAKNRNGGLVRNRMKFIGKYTLFMDIDHEEDWIEEEFTAPPIQPLENPWADENDDTAIKTRDYTPF